MEATMSHYGFFAWLLFFLCTAGGARSEDCSFLGADPVTLLDRQVYVQNDAGVWAELTQPLQSLINRPTKLAYVFREQFRNRRQGVVIIKSGRNRHPTEMQRGLREKSVALVREKGSYCKGSSAFSGAVSAKSYDDYHDIGRGGDEISTIKSFHAGYIGRGKYCRMTDEKSSDSPTDLRSNRGQFSFNQSVVSEGTYVQLANWAGVSTALASSENLDDQRVEIKRYETNISLPTCVRIALPAQKRASFVRINDLEAVTFDRSDYIRAREQEWSLTPQ
jgi:hypothetical protein